MGLKAVERSIGRSVAGMSADETDRLNSIEEKVNSIGNPIKLSGSFDASSGVFPSGSKIGDAFISNDSGEIDGVAINKGDMIISLVDNASTSIYESNWMIQDNTDSVVSVNGKTGNVSIDKYDIGLENVDNTSDKDKPISDLTAKRIDEVESMISDTNNDLDNAMKIAMSSPGCVNANPYFSAGDYDYKTLLASDSATLVDDVTFNSKYSIKINSTSTVVLTGDNEFPVVSGKYYRFSTAARVQYTGDDDPEGKYVKSYFGAMFYDGDGNIISAQQLARVNGDGSTFGTLVSDINDGDTEIHIRGDLSAWQTEDAASYKRRFALYKNNGSLYQYVGKNGKLYNDKRYTRWLTAYESWDDDPSVFTDNGDGTFTISLAEAWSYSTSMYDTSRFGDIPGGKFVAGDGLMQASSGGSYVYMISGKVFYHGDNFESVNSDWILAPDSQPIGEYATYPRDGASTARVMALLNYAGTPDYTAWYSKLAIEFKNGD